MCLRAPSIGSAALASPAWAWHSNAPERRGSASHSNARHHINSMSRLFTIGYEQATAASVIGELKQAGIGLVVDTRAVAASRRPGFSKRQLAAGLDEAGIGYLHLQKLGTPKEGRDAARSGNLARLFDIYERHIATPDAREQLRSEEHTSELQSL